MDDPTHSMLIPDNGTRDHSAKPQEISKFRRYLPQVKSKCRQIFKCGYTPIIQISGYCNNGQEFINDKY